MNELIGSFAGKRLAAFGALIAAIALLAAGGALSTRTADAQGIPSAGSTATNWAGSGLDHINGGNSVAQLKVSLAVGQRHTVCLVDNIDAQQFRDDSANAASGDGDPNADPPTENSDGSGDTPGDPNDIDDWDWLVRLDNVGDPLQRSDGSNIEIGPSGYVTRVPTGTTGSTMETSTTGWNWLIMTKAGTGTPTVSNPARTFPNNGDSAEACFFWTSNAPGTQIIRLYDQNNRQVANGAPVVDFRFANANFVANEAADPDNIDVSDAKWDLEVTWVDSDPLIQVARVTTASPLGAAVSGPIAQRMTLSEQGNAFVPAGEALSIRVSAVQSALVSQALVGAKVDFAVSGNCGMVTVPGAVNAAARITDGKITPGGTASIARWGTGSVNVVFDNRSSTNAGADTPPCLLSNSMTTLTITSGGASNTVTVNWNWDGYVEYTTEDVNDTTKKVTFHTAVPRMYNALGQAVGWACENSSRMRTLRFDVDGRATVTGGEGGRSQTVTGLAMIASVGPTSQGTTTPRRALAALDTECQVSWTIRSASRAADVYIDISAMGADAFSEVLNFAPAAAPVTTFDDLEDPLAPGIDFVIWTGEDTRVADAIGDSGATAVYYWVSATQSWLSFFPGSEGLGVNSLTTLANGEIYVVSTPSN